MPEATSTLGRDLGTLAKLVQALAEHVEDVAEGKVKRSTLGAVRGVAAEAGRMALRYRR